MGSWQTAHLSFQLGKSPREGTSGFQIEGQDCCDSQQFMRPSCELDHCELLKPSALPNMVDT